MLLSFPTSPLDAVNHCEKRNAGTKTSCKPEESKYSKQQQSEMNQVQTIKKRPVHCTMNEIESSKRWEVEMFNFVQIQKLEMKEVMLISTLICMKHSMVDQQISWFTSFSTALEKVPQNTET
jgi:hypothetical protein